MESGRNGGAGAPSYLAIKGQGAANPSELFINPVWCGGEFSPTQLYLNHTGLGNLWAVQSKEPCSSPLPSALLQSSGPRLPLHR